MYGEPATVSDMPHQASPIRAISGYAPVPGSVGNWSSGHLVNVMAGSGRVTGQCDIPGL